MDLHIDLADVSGRSLRSRLEHALREAVRGGRLPPGTRLPSTRALCIQLGVSRGVVVDAYAQLAAEGYLHTRRGGGTTVAATAGRAGPPPHSARGAPATRHDTSAARHNTSAARHNTCPARDNTSPTRDSTSAARHNISPTRHDMSPFRPALSGFPRAAWSAALVRVLRTAPDERLGYPDSVGVPELRATLAAYLGRVRGVRADAEQMMITGGLRQGVGLLLSTLAAAGAERIAVEDPGWRGIRETAAEAGLQVVLVPVDDEGLVVERLEDAEVDAVALAPAHQYPTGAVLSPARRGALLAWALSRDALIVEDDYDAEYRYDRQPIGALQGLAPEHVVYGGSASKTLAPALRLSWMALPERLVAPVAGRQRRRGGVPSALEQLALADLIERGELDRHLRRQRRRYHQLRDALLAALASELPQVTVHGAAAGLYTVLHLPRGLSERSVLAAARVRGIALEGVGGATPALVVGYANLSEAAIGPAVRALAASLDDAGGRAAVRGASALESARGDGLDDPGDPAHGTAAKRDHAGERE